VRVFEVMEMELSRKELEKVVKWLDDLQREVEEINDKLDMLRSEGEPYNISAYDLDGAICLLYVDCSRCPLNSACDFYALECTKPKDCGTCPKIKVCASKRNPALIAYLVGKGSDGNDSTQTVARIPGIECLQRGRFLILRRGDGEVKFEAQPEISADGVEFRLHIVLPDSVSVPEALEKIAKAFGFQNMFHSGRNEVTFVGEGVDLYVVCRSEKVVKQTDDGYFITYHPKFALEFVPKKASV
jgi:hypothetical protein